MRNNRDDKKRNETNKTFLNLLKEEMDFIYAYLHGNQHFSKGMRLSDTGWMKKSVWNNFSYLFSEWKGMNISFNIKEIILR